MAAGIQRPITQVYETYTSYANDYERGNVVHRIAWSGRCLPEQLLSGDLLKEYKCSVSYEGNFTYHRLFPIK